MVFLVLFLLVCPLAAQDKPAEKAAPAGPATYAGSEVCQACHDDVAKAFEKNPHALVSKDKKKGWEGKACESCHGPGSKHAESASAADIQNPAKIAPAQADSACLGCHVKTPVHVGNPNSIHAKNGVACVACHSIHKGPAAMVARKAPAVNALCKSCHVSQWAQFQRPYRHKLPEGAMSCVDCHNQHGSYSGRTFQSVSANEAACFKCHGDKRGPFAFDHAPVKLEGCSTCHEPHGSANPRMLTRAQIRFMCLECHSNVWGPKSATNAGQVIGSTPPAIHDLRNPRFQNCTTCHQKIHGSHVDRALLR